MSRRRLRRRGLEGAQHHVGLAQGAVPQQVQLFMWQWNIVGVAHYIMVWFEVLGALDDAPDDASTSSSSALAAG